MPREKLSLVVTRISNLYMAICAFYETKRVRSLINDAKEKGKVHVTDG